MFNLANSHLSMPFRSHLFENHKRTMKAYDTVRMRDIYLAIKVHGLVLQTFCIINSECQRNANTSMFICIPFQCSFPHPVLGPGRSCGMRNCKVLGLCAGRKLNQHKNQQTCSLLIPVKAIKIFCSFLCGRQTRPPLVTPLKCIAWWVTYVDSSTDDSKWRALTTKCLLMQVQKH